VSDDAERARRAERLVVELGAAFQQRAVYPSTHPQVRRAVARAVTAFDELCAARGAHEVSLLLLEGELLLDREPLPENSHWSRGLRLAFARHGLGGMTLRSGLDADELAAFLDSCSAPGGPAPTRHVLIGHAGFVGSEAPEGAASGFAANERPPVARPDQLAAAKGELVGVATGRAPRIDRLREMIARLAHAAAGARLEAPRLPVVEVEDAAFVHGLAVALGSLRLGVALGLEGDALEELGLAGLLHDVGHLEPAPDEDAATRRRLHTVRGAARLAAVEGLPDVALLVAYEHHLRFDTRPNYPLLAAPRRPVAAARVVAVADTWETVRTRGGATADEALWLLRDRAGGYLDPDLVDLFAALVAAGPGRPG
jgi:hypothetical protein